MPGGTVAVGRQLTRRKLAPVSVLLLRFQVLLSVLRDLLRWKEGIRARAAFKKSPACDIVKDTHGA